MNAQSAAAIAAWIVAVVVGGLGLVLVVMSAVGKIDLSTLLKEDSGDGPRASLAKLQLLIFTFVVALSLFAITIAKGAFPEIPPNVLVLLGISASTTLISGGIAAVRRVRLAEIRAGMNAPPASV